MKRHLNLFSFAIFSITIFLFKNANAGCDGVSIYATNRPSNCTQNQEVKSIPKNGTTTLFASYNECCHEMGSLGTDGLVWFRNGVAIDTTFDYTLIDEIVTHQITVSDTGTYTVFFKNFVGENYQCGSVRVKYNKKPGVLNNSIPISVLSSIGQESDNLIDQYFNIFPNPFTENITVTVDPKLLYGAGTTTFKLFSITGERIKEISIPSNESDMIKLVVYREDLPSGVYFYQLFNEEKVIKTGKLIAQ